MVVSHILILISITPVVATKAYLAVMRPRSKHTSLFEPIDLWTLPENELQERYDLEQGVKSRMIFKPFRQSMSACSPTSIFKLITIDNSSHSLKSLIRAANQCVLVHGLYEVLAVENSLSNVTLLDSAAMYRENILQTHGGSSFRRNRTLNIAVGVVNQPWLAKDDINSIINRCYPVLNMLTSTFDPDWETPMDIRVFCNSLPRKCSNQSTADILGVGIDNFEDATSKDAITDEFVVICRKIAAGIASPTLTGMGHHDPLPMTNAFRRPSSGLLSRFALHKLPYRTPTAMEPELGLLMASLARVGVAKGMHVNEPKTVICEIEKDSEEQVGNDDGASVGTSSRSYNYTVFDPFCGCGAILLAAAHQGASRVVGMDAAMTHESAVGIVDNFRSQGLTGAMQRHSHMHRHSHTLLRGFVQQLVPPAASSPRPESDAPLLPSLPCRESEFGRIIVYDHWIHRDCGDCNRSSSRNSSNIDSRSSSSSSSSSGSGCSSSSSSDAMWGACPIDQTDFMAEWQQIRFDAIITDPPYDMKEKVQVRPSVAAGEALQSSMSTGRAAAGVVAVVAVVDVEDGIARGELAQGSPEPTASTHSNTLEPTASTHSNTSEPTASTHSNTPEPTASTHSNTLSVIEALLHIASHKLKVGGRLVFFAPHVTPLHSEDGMGEDLSVELGSVRGDGRKGKHDIQDKRRRLLGLPRLQKSTKIIREFLDQGLVSALDTVGNRAPDAPTLSFLPPLPDNLRLVSAHQQLLSQTFSRWLCVIECIR